MDRRVTSNDPAAGEGADIGVDQAVDGTASPARRSIPVGLVVAVFLGVTIAGLIAVGFVDATRACRHWEGSGTSYDRCWRRTRPAAPYVLLGLFAYLCAVSAVVAHGGRRGAAARDLWLRISVVTVTVLFDAWLAMGLDIVPLREGGYPFVLLPTLVLVNAASAWWLATAAVERDATALLPWCSVVLSGSLAVAADQWAHLDGVLFWFVPAVGLGLACGWAVGSAIADARATPVTPVVRRAMAIAVPIVCLVAAVAVRP